jgi:hypothetical protein
MKCFIVFAALVAAVSASHFYGAPLAYAPAYAPAAYIPQSRFTRTDWAVPTQVHIPAVTQHAYVNPGYTTYHAAAAPVVAHAPVVAAAAIAGPAVYSPYTYGHHAGLVASPFLIKKK